MLYLKPQSKDVDTDLSTDTLQVCSSQTADVNAVSPTRLSQSYLCTGHKRFLGNIDANGGGRGGIVPGVLDNVNPSIISQKQIIESVLRPFTACE